MNTPLGRGLAVFGLLLFFGIVGYFVAPIEPSPRYNIAEADRPPIVVMDWLRNTVTPALSLNSQNYNQRLQAIEPLFVPEGYRDYIILLQQAGVIHNLQNNSVNFDVSMSSLELANWGLRDGAYTWIFDTKLELAVSFGTNRVSTPVDLFVLVSRTAEPGAIDGLKIRSLVLHNQVPVSN